MSDSQTVDAVVVGAGFAGLYQIHLLRENGFTVRAFEAGEGVGGTWFWNRYPGARCDVQSIYYSYSFSPELEQEWTWTERFPSQPEILRYVNHVADRFDLRRHISFSTRVDSAIFDEATARWTVLTDAGEAVTARFVIMATGCLSVPKLPEVDGIADFQGETYHTSRWPEEGVDFTGKRVAVFGTGSSGIQVIPIIAEQAAELTVFQRTPAFSLAARNRPLEPGELDGVRSRYRDIRAQQRVSAVGIPTDPPTESIFEASEAERTAKFEAAAEVGDPSPIVGGYIDIAVDKAANDVAAEFYRSKIRQRVTDPDLAETLSPRSYPIGTKRPCLDTGYYETFNRPNVRLVDLRKTPLVGVTPKGARTSEEDFAFDAIVFATGFDAMTGALNAVDIRGRGGLVLREKWGEGPRSYLGLAVAGFPNLFTITGPSSPSVLSNVIVSIEQHVEWVTDCLRHVRDQELATVEPTEEAEDGWVAHVAEVANATLYPSADSWYLGANVPGKPRVFMAYLGGVGPYRELCAGVAARGYEGFELAKEP